MARKRKKKTTKINHDGPLTRSATLRRTESGARVYLSLEHAAIAASVPLGTLLKWVRGNVIPSKTLKGKIFLQREDLIHAIEAQSN